MKINQKGFSAVELILILVIVGLIGVVGWFIYDKQQNNKNSNEQATTQNTEQKETTDVDTLPAGHISYENEALGIKFNYPESWGEVSVSQRARNIEEYEPVKTHFIDFDKLPKFSIKISPTTWKFTGGDGEFDFPATDDSFQQALKGEYALQITKNSTSYLQMEYSEFDRAVTMKGAKKLELTKVPAEFAEFVWAPVSDNCLEETADGIMKPQASCYAQDLVDDTQKVLESFKSI